MAIDPQIKQYIDQQIQAEIQDATIFSTPKYGDTPTDKNQLANKNYVDQFGAASVFGAKGDILVGSGASVFSRLGVGTDGQILTANSTATFGIDWEAAPLKSAGIFGNGADGFAAFDSVSSVNGASIVSASKYALTRDVYYTNVSVTSGVIVLGSSYQIFCSGDISINGTISNAGAIGSVGGTGNDGVATSTGGNGGGGGFGGASILSGTLPGVLRGAFGGNGGKGGFTSNGQSGAVGDAGASVLTSVGSPSSVNGTTNTLGIGGVANAQTGGPGGGGGGHGSIISAFNLPNTISGALIHADLLTSYIPHSGSGFGGGSGGGGGGAGDANGGGGGGGGGGGTGGNGGFIALFSNSITNNVASGITVQGGNGGNGGPGGNGGGGGTQQAGGGGGGAGGNGGTGGVVILVYRTLTGTGTINISGGSGGSGGAGGAAAGTNAQPGVTGNNGVSGASGVLYKIPV